MKMNSLRLYYNLLFFFLIISKVRTIDIPTGEVSVQNLKVSETIELNFNSDEKILLIHILSIDCQIKLESVENNNVKVYKINNYNYNAFFIRIKKISYTFGISPLINSPRELSQNRNYNLIINSVINDGSNIPKLNMTKNEPVFLYFNKNLKNIILLYKFEKRDLKYPIIISFFIKEKIEFRIKISDGNNNIIIDRIVNYKENIIIKPESDKTYNISISPEEVNIEKYPATMIAKIIQNNNTPFYLQKNQLNLGFIPIEIDKYYYYMEVFKGEEGEIMLFNKRQNGILISKLIKKKKIPEIKEFPEYNEKNLLSEFNIYNQKLSFYSSDTEICQKGCFLLITYYSNISKYLEINGTEFSILSRIWDEEEFESQINNIPLNEYIFGFFDEASVNIHYYSVFIPYESNNIYIEIHGNNINGFLKEGIVKINTYKLTNNTKIIFGEYQKKKIFTLKKEDIGLNSFKGKYISFAFEQGFSDYSYYYFRIHQNNTEDDYIIYSLDTNKENYCEIKNNKCYFLLKNDYNDLSNTIFIYGFGEINTFYNVSSINYTDYYPKNLNSDYLKEIKEIGSYKDYLSFDLKSNDSFVLILIETNSTENKYLTVFSSLYNLRNSPFINLYSYQLYNLTEKSSQQFYLYKNPLIDYRILINNTEGEGDICFNQSYDNKNNLIHLTEQKIYSFSISNKTNFLFIYAQNNIIFNIKIIYEFSKETIKELNYLYNYVEIDNNEEIFPLIYIIKDVKYNGININFNFNISNNINNAYNNLVIKGYGLDYSEILSIKEKDDIKMIDFPYNEIKGKYDNITNSGCIELSNQLIKTKYNEIEKYTEDIYYFIIIKNITSFDLKILANDIYIISKDENNIILPINKYTRNSFYLLKNENIIQKYFFEKENITNNEFILEFSSNYENIEIIFNDLTNCSITEIFGGFKKYVLSINSTNSTDYYFNLTINPIEELNSIQSLKEVNIIIKYYNKRQKINTDYICNKNFKLEKINIREKNSDYNLIIDNNDEISNSQNDLNYIYYLRLIKKSKVLNNEELNTIASISSDLLYIDKFNTSEPNKEILFNLNNLENNEKYIASLFIKVYNENGEEEIYYSMTYEFNTNKQEKADANKWMIVALIAIAIFIINLLLFFIFCRKMKIKNKSLENKVNAISFSTGINQDLINNRDSENSKKSEDYENTFI